MPSVNIDDSPALWWQSRRLHYLGLNALAVLSICIVFRAIFLFGFTELEVNKEALGSFWIGTKFDIRLSILVLLPIVAMSVLPVINILRSTISRLIVRGYLTLIMTLLCLVNILDLGHYQYLGKRVDSTVIRFFDDPLISGAMVWQSYPVLTISAALAMFVVLLYLGLRHIERVTIQLPARPASWIQKTIGATVVLLAMIVGAHGRILDINLHNPVPLRWNDALVSQNNAVNALGLNPVLFLYDTFEQRELPYDEAVIADYHPDMVRYLGVTNDAPLSLDRQIEPAAHALTFDRPPNIIFIMLESLGASRLGAWGNPISPSPTPHLDRLAREGWFFPNFYVPVSGTARTVWASLTGLPDVSSVKTATRNPFITNQRVVINDLVDHEKFYFIGGSAGWANMSAFIQQSIPDIRFYEEQDWDAPIVDVWGISDLDLFISANAVLTERQQHSDKPFFAYIQTAGNHRPFTVPDNNGSFEPRDDLSDEALGEAGFRSNAQFNAVRLLDYNVGEFIRLADEAGYLDNSIIVMFGDHNNRVTKTDGFMPPHFDALDLDGLHVPLIIYSPTHLQPNTYNNAASLVDLMPTMAGWLGVPYLNTTMGRDLNAASTEDDRSVYIQTSDKRFPVIGMVNSRFALRMNRDGTNAKLHPLFTDNPWQDLAAKHPDEFERLKRQARGVYELTRYQMYANSGADQNND